MFKHKNITPKFGVKLLDDPKLTEFSDPEIKHLNEFAVEDGVVFTLWV